MITWNLTSDLTTGNLFAPPGIEILVPWKNRTRWPKVPSDLLEPCVISQVWYFWKTCAVPTKVKLAGMAKLCEGLCRNTSDTSVLQQAKWKQKWATNRYSKWLLRVCSAKMRLNLSGNFSIFGGGVVAICGETSINLRSGWISLFLDKPQTNAGPPTCTFYFRGKCTWPEAWLAPNCLLFQGSIFELLFVLLYGHCQECGHGRFLSTHQLLFYQNIRVLMLQYTGRLLQMIQSF